MRYVKMVASTTSGIKDMRVDGQDLIIIKEDDNELVILFLTLENDLDWLFFTE